MITATKLRELMTKNVVTIASSDPIWDIQRIFSINHLRHAPVCEDGKVMGMISLIDLRHLRSEEDRDDVTNQEVQKLTAVHIMAPDPVTLQGNQTVKEAALLFTENEFHAIPVLEGGTLVGIISTTDMISFLIDALDQKEDN